MCEEGVLRLIVKRLPSGLYCHEHNEKRLDTTRDPNEYYPKQRTRIKPRSAKRAAEEALYHGKTKPEFLDKNPTCQANVINQKGEYLCTHTAIEAHHMAGKEGDLLNDKTNLLAVCRPCHTWIEMNPKSAKEKGYSRSRLESKEKIIPEGEWANDWKDQIE
jgi:hypothetical protein